MLAEERHARIVEMVPDVVDKVSGFIKKKTEEPVVE